MQNAIKGLFDTAPSKTTPSKSERFFHMVILERMKDKSRTEQINFFKEVFPEFYKAKTSGKSKRQNFANYLTRLEQDFAEFEVKLKEYGLEIKIYSR